MKPPSPAGTPRAAGGGAVFVPVVGPTHAPPAATSAAPVGIIEVALGGAVVRGPSEVDGKLLAKVLRAVKSVA